MLQNRLTQITKLFHRQSSSTSVSDTVASEVPGSSTEDPCFKHIKKQGRNPEYMQITSDDKDLRDYLTMILDDTDTKLIPIDTLVVYVEELKSGFSRLDYESSRMGALKQKVNQIVEFVETRHKDKLEQLRELFKDNKFTFKDMMSYYVVGEQYFYTIYTTTAIGVLKSKTKDYHERIVLELEYFHYDNTTESFRKATYKAHINPFVGIKAEADLPVRRVLPEIDISKYVQRGRNYEKYASKGTYVVNNTGPRIVRDYGVIEKNATGRVIINNVKDVRDVDPYDNVVVERGGGVDFFEKIPIEMLHTAWPYLEGFSINHEYGSGLFNVEYMSDVVYNEKAYDELCLSSTSSGIDIKDLVKTAVLNKPNVSYADIMPGKSTGFICLLYGEPGVGKTLTAEAISELAHMPLYKVGFGSLGTTPAHIEKNIDEIFTRVTKWNAMLLIDEVDAIIEKRGKDLTMNAIVSIFLRYIENFSGILFLTTNRHTTIDPAFDSRITLKLKYEFTEEMREKVFRHNLVAIGAPDDTVEYSTVLKSRNANGRQITNIMKLCLLFTNGAGPSVSRELVDKAMLLSDVI